MCIGTLIIGALIIVQTKRFTMNVDQQIAFTYRLAIIFLFVLFCAGCCLPSLVLYRQTDTVSHLGLYEHVNSASHILSIRTKFHCVHVNYEEFLFLCSL